MLNSQTISLENFEGPLDLLLHLIQKNEINIYDVCLQNITQQFLESLDKIINARVDMGAEFLGITTTLLLIKSQKLLPQVQSQKTIEEEDPRFILIQQLVEYCSFKEISKKLLEREELELHRYERGIYQLPPERKELFLGPLENLQAILVQMLKKKSKELTAVVDDEKWLLADKVFWIKQELTVSGSCTFEHLFCSVKTKDELIVIFLAILELMKCGEVSIMDSGIHSVYVKGAED